MLHVYSLADYQITIGISEEFAKTYNLKDGDETLKGYQIGGPGADGTGSFVGRIQVERAEDAWTTVGDKTGSWVHNRSRNKVGRITLELNQISDQTIDLYHLCQFYDDLENTYEGLTITINAANQEQETTLVKAIDCYVVKQADYPMSETASNLTWVFTCGQIEYFSE